MTDEELHQYVEGRVWRWLPLDNWNSLSGDLRDKLYREVFFKLWKNMNMIQKK
jgi:hypothetical protein